MNNTATDPLWTVASVTAACTAILTAATAFGLDMSADQTAAVMGLVAVAAPLLVAWIGRGRVYSPATVTRIKAAQAPPSE